MYRQETAEFIVFHHFGQAKRETVLRSNQPERGQVPIVRPHGRTDLCGSWFFFQRHTRMFETEESPTVSGGASFLRLGRVCLNGQS
jgi:hypothetical protein